jgi:O-methyltransferase involved in polyketide biosynthesis
VEALAEGLQTSFWRLGAAIPAGQFRWLTVDLPEIVDVRARLLPASPRVSMWCQVRVGLQLDGSVDPSDGVFITAEGLLMYLEPEQALGLIAQCAKRFPGGRFGARTSRRYKGPPMPFSLSVKQAANLVTTVPGVGAVRDLQLPPGRG